MADTAGVPHLEALNAWRELTGVPTPEQLAGAARILGVEPEAKAS